MKSSRGKRSARNRTPSGLCAPSRISARRSSRRPGSTISTSRFDLVADERLGCLSRATDPDLVAGDQMRVCVVGQDHNRLTPRDRQLLAGDPLERVPRTSVCSSETFVRSTTRVSTTFVASSLPPSPASTTAASTSASANAASAAAVTVSNWVASRRSATDRTSPTACSKSASAPFTRIRSLQPRTCGEIVVPTLRPPDSSNCSIVTAAVDFPFVPTTCTAGYASCGSPSSASIVFIRSSPNRCGQGTGNRARRRCSCASSLARGFTRRSSAYHRALL